MPQISKEKQVFVVEKFFEKKLHSNSRSQHFDSDLIRHLLAKKNSTKIYKIQLSWNDSKIEQIKFWKTKDCSF